MISLFILLDQDRLILYSRTAGKLVTSFYGAVNDEFSQPRHCWDPSGQYIYGVSAVCYPLMDLVVYLLVVMKIISQGTSDRDGNSSVILYIFLNLLLRDLLFIFHHFAIVQLHLLFCALNEAYSLWSIN